MNDLPVAVTLTTVPPLPHPSMHDVSFRTAAGPDALCIGVLATQVFLDTYATKGIRPSLAREALHHYSTDAISAVLASPAVTFIVAEGAGHMIAFAQLTHGATQALVTVARAAELNRLYVQERFAGKGLGTALLRHVENVAAARGASALWLTAWVGNPRALAFYPRKGYQDVGATMYEFEGEQFENRVFLRRLVDDAAP